MLIKKKFWNLISTEPCPKRQNLRIWAKKIKKYRMAVGIAQQIMKEGIRNQIAFNFMDIEDPKQIWHKLKSIYIKVGPGVIYLILQKLFYYPSIMELKEYKKLVM